MSSYVMSQDNPVMLKAHFDFWDVMDELDTLVWSGEEKPSPTADIIKWVDKIAKQIGFTSIENFPVLYDGDGCSVISRYKKPEECAKEFADFEYIAFLSINYDHPVIIGIPNDMALLQFYRLVRPMLMLKSEKRFQNAANHGETWNQGKNYRNLYQSLLASWKKRQVNKKGKNS